MKLKVLILLMALCMLGTTVLTACSGENNGKEVDTSETLAPPYDYLGKDILSDVTITSSAYTSMQLTLPSEYIITDQDVEDSITYYRFQYRLADTGEKMTDQPMKMGDDAYIYYRGELDGVPFDGGSNWDDKTPYALSLGSGSFIPGFEEALYGVIPAEATKDEPAEVHVTFPKNYDAADLAGKAVIFYVAVEYAVQYTLPTYNREFVEKTVRYTGKQATYESDEAYLAEFETYIRNTLEENIAESRQEAMVTVMWEHLLANATCRNHPQKELDAYYETYVEDIVYAYSMYANYYGSSFTAMYPTQEDFARSYVGVGKDGDWRAELEKQSRTSVEKNMIAHAIAEVEGIETVTEQEFLEEVERWVSEYDGKMTAEEVIHYFGEAGLREMAFLKKMESWLMARATFGIESDEA